MDFSSVLKVLEDLLNLVFPLKCQGCGQVSKDIICSKCRASFDYILPPMCSLCGVPLNVEDNMDLCRLCKRNPPNFVLCRSIFYYKERLRDILLKVKYRGKFSLIPPLSLYISAFLDENRLLFPIDVIVPVPKGGGSKNGPVRSFIVVLCELLNNYTVKNVLYRKRNTKPQSSLNFNERWENVKDAFYVREKEYIKGRNILLIDDIYTSGATIINCTKALLEGGASKVWVITLSRTPQSFNI